MTKLFTAYRILAIAVGVLLLLGTLSVLLTGKLETLTLYHVAEYSTPYKIGHPLGLVWILHGWVYIAYLVVAFVLTHRVGWPMTTFGVMILAGLVPVTMFFAEHHYAARFRAEVPELSAA